MNRLPAGCPSGSTVKSATAVLPGVTGPLAAGLPPPAAVVAAGGGVAGLVLPAGAVDTPGATGGSATWAGWLAAGAGLAACRALLIRAPAIVAPASTATAAATPTTRMGPPGMRGFWTNVTVRLAARSGVALARIVRVRRAS